MKNFISALALCLVVNTALTNAALAELPPVPMPLNIPVRAEKIELGNTLFFEQRLSQDGTVSCATCHKPERGWSDGEPVAVGIRGQLGTRNSPTIINAAYGDHQFLDSRVVGISTQAILPFKN